MALVDREREVTAEEPTKMEDYRVWGTPILV